MAFRTKIDISDNRQIKKRENSITSLPGVTQFGLDVENLTVGPDLDTVKVLIPSVNNISSTFTGNTDTGEYSYSFGYEDMSVGVNEINHFTLDNSPGDVVEVGPIWIGKGEMEVDGITLYTSYEGIKYDLTLVSIIDEGDGNVSGTTVSTYEKLGADALEHTNDFIWVDVLGNIKTDGLIIKKVGVGPSTIQLGINNEGKVVNVASDERLKENIEPIKNALDKVLGLNGVTYNWKDRVSGGDSIRIGFLANDVKTVVPELVYELGEDNLKGVHYGDTVALIVEAFKELVSLIQSNNNQNNNVEPIIEQRDVSVEVIYSEDNELVLNYNGTHETAKEGGITVAMGVSHEEDSKLRLTENGDWEFLPNVALKNFTPKSSDDPNGNPGNITFDDEYFYVRTRKGWRRSSLKEF